MLLRNDNDTDGEKTYQLADNVKNYDMLFVAWGSVDDPAFNNQYVTRTAIVYHNGMSAAWSYSDGSSSTKNYYRIDGATWEGRGFNPDPPRLVLGFRL